MRAPRCRQLRDPGARAHAARPDPRPASADDAHALGIDVRDAALRALEASEPAAPLLVLDLTSDSLQRLLQRMATAATPQAA